MGVEQVPTFCPLCVSRCGARAIVTDGAFVALEPDPSHPTGAALCIKGKAAPEIVRHPERLLHPLKRTNPKGAADPGWQPITWDEALDTIAARLLALAREHGPESVVFSTTSPSTSAMSDAVDWLNRLRRAFGSPNLCTYMELCGWRRYLASVYTYGEAVPGAYLPDLDHAGCILYWGYNPSVARLAHATGTVAALRRGAKLVVVDPRKAGLAGRADHWLRVRPGTDGALALALTHVMIERRWFDEDFVRRWTNAPLLVRDDTGRLLRAGDLAAGGDPAHYVAWDSVGGGPVGYDRPAFDLVAAQCRRMAPALAESMTGVPAAEIEQTARTLWQSRPVAFYTWSGLEQHSNTTQTVRAINQLYALTGSFDTRGGNVLFPAVPTNPIDGAGLLAPEQRAKALGRARRPLGPARFEFVTGEDLYTAVLDGDPYPARGLVNFGANPALPEFEEPRISPRSRPDLAHRYPLILTCAKPLWFCETQHRNVASLRKSAPDPQVELHPDTAAARGIAAGDWVRIQTPHGDVRARARFNTSLDRQVVCGQHGWWQACAELGLPGYPPFGPGSANLNLVLRQQPSDPVSGSSPLRASVCDVAVALPDPD